MKTTQTFQTLGLLTVLLTGCVPNTYHETVIQNNSTYDILVYEKWYHGDVSEWPDSSLALFQSDTHLIKTGTSEALFVSSGETAELSDFDTCLRISSGIIVLSSKVVGYDSLSVQTDINDIDEWVFTVRDRRKENTGDCECRLTIENTDLN